jgi:hypothetical protein
VEWIGEECVKRQRDFPRSLFILLSSIYSLATFLPSPFPSPCIFSFRSMSIVHHDWKCSPSTLRRTLLTRGLHLAITRTSDAHSSSLRPLFSVSPPFPCCDYACRIHRPTRNPNILSSLLSSCFSHLASVSTVSELRFLLAPSEGVCCALIDTAESHCPPFPRAVALAAVSTLFLLN